MHHFHLVLVATMLKLTVILFISAPPQRVYQTPLLVQFLSVAGQPDVAVCMYVLRVDVDVSQRPGAWEQFCNLVQRHVKTKNGSVIFCTCEKR